MAYFKQLRPYLGVVVLIRLVLNAIPIALFLFCGRGFAQYVSPPVEWGRFGFTLGYQYQKGIGQYLAGKERFNLDSQSPAPIAQNIPIEMHYGYLPGTEIFYESSGEFRNEENMDASGLNRISFGIKSAFPELLGLGFILVLQYPDVTGSLDKVYSPYVKGFQYGGFYHYRWDHFQLTALVVQSFHPGGVNHPDAANSLRIETKPEALWGEKWFAYWSVRYQQWDQIPGDLSNADIPERFVLNASPGLGVKVGKTFRGEVTYLSPFDGKNLTVFQGVEAKLFYTPTWNILLE